MNKILILVKKELNSYFNSPLGYIVVSIFLLITGWLFIQGFFVSAQASMRSFFGLIPFILMFILPAVTMSSWSEEKRSGTVEVLMSFPISNFQVVLAKFLSNFIFLGIMLALTLAIPSMISNLGAPDKGIIMAGYLGTLLLGASYIAVGLWVSSVTKNQIVSFITTVAIVFAFYIIGNSFILDALPAFIGEIGKFLSFSTHFNSILRGVISLSDIVYYISIVLFFMFLNTNVVSSRKWK
ncbi:MAG: ABC transporter permease [Candidatus Pacebacteria bacterium]|nr:ABC transporter permease [Candidatus Paceibacterota bacterium]